MNWKSFIRPTTTKLKALAIILIAIFVSSVVSDFFVGLLVPIPGELANDILTMPMSEAMIEHMPELLLYGFKIIAIEFLVLLASLYVALSFILNPRKNRRLPE